MPDDINPNDSDQDDELFAGIESMEIQDEMERSFLDYAMSVIVSRALPDARDGLKPVHRRILYGMGELGLRPDRPFVKSANVVGAVMGNYHPHGDQAIYDALARMVQDFSLRHPLLAGHGNFGSPDPSRGPAAMRYTECRLGELAMRMLEGIDEDTVNFTATYDSRREEPVVLPSRFPNLLVNGSQGIAVGMATSIPPHNLGEVIDATTHLIDNPAATPDDLMQFVKGPDFPTAAQILGRQGIFDAYRTGRGSIKMRAVAEIVETKKGEQIIISELPYQTSVEAIERKIEDLVSSKQLDGIRKVTDASAKGETRLIVELKRDANANVLLNNLYKYTPLQTSFGVNMLALVDGVPRTLNLAQMLHAYIDHQVEVVTRRTQFRLGKAKAREHIVEGLVRAIDMIDAIIALIRASENREEARSGLIAEPFLFSEIQANHILDMPLGRLTRLGRTELEAELGDLRARIAEFESILASREKLNGVIKTELSEVREKFATPRRSKLVVDTGELGLEDLIDDEEMVITLTRGGYVKSMASDTFKTQGRGGRGVKGANLKDQDYVAHVISTTAHSFILLFSNRGRVYRLKGHEIPMKERTARGTAIVNLLPLSPGETIEAVIDTRDYEVTKYLLFATKQGIVKKTAFSEYDSSLRAGIIAINLRDNDELVRVIQLNDSDEVLMVSKRGQTIRFSSEDVRATGRATAGVKGMAMKGDDEVVSCDLAVDESFLLMVTDSGYGKRTAVKNFNAQGRGGQGVIGIKLTAQKGHVTSAFLVSADDDIVVISSNGTTIRMGVKGISKQGRTATGVRVVSLDPGNHVAAVAKVLSQEDE